VTAARAAPGTRRGRPAQDAPPIATAATQHDPTTVSDSAADLLLPGVTGVDPAMRAALVTRVRAATTQPIPTPHEPSRWLDADDATQVAGLALVALLAVAEVSPGGVAHRLGAEEREYAWRLRQASYDVADARDWMATARRHVTYAELERQRGDAA
jgi:hypothetical protein